MSRFEREQALGPREKLGDSRKRKDLRTREDSSCAGNCVRHVRIHGVAKSSLRHRSLASRRSRYSTREHEQRVISSPLYIRYMGHHRGGGVGGGGRGGL